MLHLCDCVEGSLSLVVSFVTHLRSVSINLQFETLCESICLVVADLWPREYKSGCFRNGTFIVLQPCQSQVMFS